MKRAANDSRPSFTPRQGQYLAYIHAYTLVSGHPPAEMDMMLFFRVTPPTVHQMVLTLEQAGLNSRLPRSIALLLDRSALPELLPSDVQPVKITRSRSLAEPLLLPASHLFPAAAGRTCDAARSKYLPGDSL